MQEGARRPSCKWTGCQAVVLRILFCGSVLVELTINRWNKILIRTEEQSRLFISNWRLEGRDQVTVLRTWRRLVSPSVRSRI